MFDLLRQFSCLICALNIDRKIITSSKSTMHKSLPNYEVNVETKLIMYIEIFGSTNFCLQYQIVKIYKIYICDGLNEHFIHLILRPGRTSCWVKNRSQLLPSRHVKQRLRQFLALDHHATFTHRQCRKGSFSSGLNCKI